MGKGTMSYSIVELSGYLGSFLLAVCGAPEAWRSIKRKKCDIGYAFLIMWLAGEVLLCYYNTEVNSIPLYINYGFNILLISIMLFYRTFRRNK
jgi:hypothetical protein